MEIDEFLKAKRLDMGGLLMDLATLLQRPAGIVTERGLKKRIRNRVLRKAMPL